MMEGGGMSPGMDLGMAENPKSTSYINHEEIEIGANSNSKHMSFDKPLKSGIKNSTK